MQIYGNDIKAVILYGSYARGDFREDSDKRYRRRQRACKV
ncbi:nucleotidyltransferase domain-containing protein [Enterocloster clostridioformis]